MNDEPTVPVAEAIDPLNTGATFGTTDRPRRPVVDNPPASVAVRVRELVPVAEAVPVMPPVVGFIVKPVGKPAIV